MSADAVPQLDRTVVARITASRPRVRPIRVLQFGTGRFLLGFLGDFIDRANRGGGFDGRIVAVQSTGNDRAATINRQDGAYTLVRRGVRGGQAVEEHNVPDSLQRAIAVQEEWPAVLALARDPALTVVVSNTTEVGLGLDPHDRPDEPRSYSARLAAVLIARYRALGNVSGHGLVILPCELIEANGDVLRQNVLTLTRAWEAGEAFHAWLTRDCRFCNTLVDRIVTGRPPEVERSAWWRKLGYRDALLTIVEPYALWAIEGDDSVRERIGFAHANPAIIVTPDISRYRELKLRILNGAHTASAALGLLIGHRTVIEAMSDPMIAAFVEQLLRTEIAPTLPFDAAQVHSYIDEVLDRLRNPRLGHALLDIAAHSTVKIRSRLVPVICRAVAQRGRAPKRLALGFAAHLCFLREVAFNRPDFACWAADERDEQIVGLWRGVRHEASHATVHEAVLSILRNEALWGVDLSARADFSGSVARFVYLGLSHGLGSALQQAVAP